MVVVSGASEVQADRQLIKSVPSGAAIAAANQVPLECVQVTVLVYFGDEHDDHDRDREWLLLARCSVSFNPTARPSFVGP